MSQKSPHFDHPPVVETVLGVQFSPLAKFTNGHLGWYWKRYLGEEWSKSSDAPALPDQFETFDEQSRWSNTGLQLIVEPAAKPARLQVSNEGGGRMIQVQASRFLYNWQRRAAVYPSYDKMRGEFDRLFADFRRFTTDAGLGDVVPNQWELTYVDHIPRGMLWNSPADWDKVLPGIFAPRWAFLGTRLESVGSEWHCEIEPRRGRLHIVLQHVRAGSASGPEVLQLQTTARGPVRKEQGWDLDSGLRLGHDVIINAFLEMTSPQAQQAWGRRD
jgi:uncharacterized protein (TIGR04255 family)